MAIRPTKSSGFTTGKARDLTKEAAPVTKSDKGRGSPTPRAFETQPPIDAFAPPDVFAPPEITRSATELMDNAEPLVRVAEATGTTSEDLRSEIDKRTDEQVQADREAAEQRERELLEQRERDLGIEAALPRFAEHIRTTWARLNYLRDELRRLKADYDRPRGNGDHYAELTKLEADILRVQNEELPPAEARWNAIGAQVGRLNRNEEKNPAEEFLQLAWTRWILPRAAELDAGTFPDRDIQRAWNLGRTGRGDTSVSDMGGNGPPPVTSSSTSGFPWWLLFMLFGGF